MWGTHRVQTSDALQVPTAGIVSIEFLTPERDIRQGIDLKLDGWIELPNRDRVPLLRTWLDPRFEDRLEYPYFSREGILRTWNVYEMVYSGGQKVEEKWTGNAGFWVEVKSDCERVYHCSHGAAGIPDFEAMAYRLTVKSRDAGSVA